MRFLVDQNRSPRLAAVLRDRGHDAVHTPRLWTAVRELLQGTTRRGCWRPIVIDADTKTRMEGILARIQSGEFARDFFLDNRANQASFKAMRRRAADHQIEHAARSCAG